MDKTRRSIIVSLLGFSLGVAWPVTAAEEITVENAWVRLATGDQPATAYFTILNHSEPDRLLEITSTATDKITLSQLEWHGLTARLKPIESLKIPGIHRVEFKPGGYAAVFGNMNEPLSIGQIVPLALRFEHAGTVNVEARVTNPKLKIEDD